MSLQERINSGHHKSAEGFSGHQHAGASAASCATETISKEAAAALCGQTTGLYLLQEQTLWGTFQISYQKPLACQRDSLLLSQQPALVPCGVRD